jgi:hypothetical protein
MPGRIEQPAGTASAEARSRSSPHGIARAVEAAQGGGDIDLVAQAFEQCQKGTGHRPVARGTGWSTGLSGA